MGPSATAPPALSISTALVGSVPVFVCSAQPLTELNSICPFVYSHSLITVWHEDIKFYSWFLLHYLQDMEDEVKIRVTTLITTVEVKFYYDVV